MTDEKPADPRGAYREALIDLAERDSRVVCVDTDTGGLENSFAERFPDRYFNVGIAEANMFGIAAGLASRGYVPYTHTMASFATMRAGEQLKLDIVGNKLPVRVVATHSGLSATHFGTTHYALEDLAVVRALMDVTVVVPGDTAEVGPAVRAMHDVSGPAYLRLGRSPTPPLRDDASSDFTLGQIVTHVEGDDVTIVAMGPYPVLMAIETAQSFAEEGVSCRVLQVHTLSPLDTAALVAAAQSTAGLVTVEEHRPHGGLGDAVGELVSGEHPAPHLRVAVSGTVGDVVRSHREALEAAGVSVAAIREAASQVIKTANRKG